MTKNRQAADPAPTTTGENQPPSQSRRPSTAPSEKKRGMGCCLARLFAFFLMLVMIATIVAFAWRFVTHNQLQTKLADYGAKGEVFGAEHLNSLYQPEENAQRATDLLAEACDDLTSQNFVNQSSGMPFVGGGEPPSYKEEWEQLEEVRELLKEYQRAAEQLREFGKLDGHVHFNLDFSVESGLDSQSIKEMDQGFNFLWLDSRVHIADGNAKLLAENIRTAMVYSNSVSDIPSADQFLRLNYDESALRLLRIGLSTVMFDKEQLDEFNLLLQEKDYRDGLKRMLYGTKVFGNQFFQDPTGYYQTQLKTQSAEHLPAALANQQRAELILKYSPTAHEDHVAFLTAIDEFEAVLDMPWDQMNDGFAELAATHKERFNSQVAQYRYPFAPQLLPDFTAYVERVQKLMIDRQVLYGALTVKRYETDKTRLPENLVDVVPDYAESLPQDPYSDEPLRYLGFKETFMIYSVGPNGTDDRGASNSDDIRISLPINVFNDGKSYTVEIDFD